MSSGANEAVDLQPLLVYNCPYRFPCSKGTRATTYQHGAPRRYHLKSYLTGYYSTMNTLFQCIQAVPQKADVFVWGIPDYFTNEHVNHFQG